MSMPGVNKKTVVISVIFMTLMVIEIALRFFMGNLAVPYKINPGDGRCIGLVPDASLKYTGWYRRVPPVIHDANGFGYRGPSYPRERRPGTFRIAVLGDSFAYGMGVNRECALPAFVERYLSQGGATRDVEVLNFGIPGINLEESVEQYKFFASNWHPDLVVLLLVENDLEASLCSRYKCPLVAGLFKHVYLLRTVYLVYRVHVPEKSGPPEKNGLPERLLSALEELQALARQNGARTVLVVLGSPLPEAGALQSITEKLELPTLAPGRRFWRDIAEVIPFEGHLTCRGNQAVAGVISQWLSAEGLISVTPNPAGGTEDK